eukprot:5975022-Karenia_brevis.AAC.1
MKSIHLSSANIPLPPLCGTVTAIIAPVFLSFPPTQTTYILTHLLGTIIPHILKQFSRLAIIAPAIPLLGSSPHTYVTPTP